MSHYCNMTASFEASQAWSRLMPRPDGNRAEREAARSAHTTTAACFADALKVEPDDASAMRHPAIADDGKASDRTNVTEMDPTDARARQQLGIAGGGSRQLIFNWAAASQRH